MQQPPAVALVLALSILGADAAAQTPKANVLVLIADDLGVDYVGCYKEGRQPANTPNLDALAARGVRFRNAWAYPLCSPTRASLMTGRYGFRTGVGHLVRGGGGGFGARRQFGPRRGARQSASPIATELTLPRYLDQAKSGYAHAKIGKWHLGGGDRGPNDVGWSHFAGLIAGVIGRSYSRWRRTVDGESRTVETYSTTQTADDALAFIESQEAAGKPWVCVVSFVAPHSPFHRPPDTLHTVPSTARDTIANYRAMVEAMDTEIGRMLRELGDARERTNVIFMGDNGTPAQVVQAPFQPREAKGKIYEGGINVPMIAAGPAIGGAPRESNALVHALDLYATISELCGVPVTQHYPKGKTLDSMSFVPVLRDPKITSTRDTVFTELFQGDFNKNGYAAIRDDRYKMIRIFRGDAKPKDRMYDLSRDPFEQKNLLRRTPPQEVSTRYAKLKSTLEQLRASK